ncbi:glutamate-rich protein 2 [Dromaius novaehollandiae]|uniref:glutamate-rich protein 2 n=1 Tax=Dromaius novaehollandiae TaxID=8790 RepID=UPI00311FA77A
MGQGSCSSRGGSSCACGHNCSLCKAREGSRPYCARGWWSRLGGPLRTSQSASQAAEARSSPPLRPAAQRLAALCCSPPGLTVSFPRAAGVAVAAGHPALFGAPDTHARTRCGPSLSPVLSISPAARGHQLRPLLPQQRPAQPAPGGSGAPAAAAAAAPAAARGALAQVPPVPTGPFGCARRCEPARFARRPGPPRPAPAGPAPPRRCHGHAGPPRPPAPSRPAASGPRTAAGAGAACAGAPRDGLTLETSVRVSRNKEIDKMENDVFGGPKEEVVIEPIQAVARWDISSKIEKNKNLSRSLPKTTQENTDENEEESRNINKAPEKELCAQIQANGIGNHNNDELLTEVSDGNNEISNEQSENEEGKFSAPIELLGEFLKAIMNGNYSLAKNLCRMILIYEPENTEAKQFFPLLEEKLLMERAQKFTEGESEDDEETIDRSSDGNKESTSSSNSSDEESEGSSDSDDPEKN